MAETGGVAVLSPFLSVAIETLTDRDHKEFLKHRKFNQGLIQELKAKMIAFGSIVDAAEEKQFGNEGVRKWLLELKDATYEAEDVLDGIQIEYQACQSKAVSEDQGRSSSSQDPLKEILDRLEYLMQESAAFGLRKAGEENRSSEKTETTSSSARPPSFEFDVFLNFRGDDTRYGFLHYFNKALKEKGIKTFYDAEDHGKGKEIEKILEKIGVSKMSIMIFSKDYASSSYCLEELVKIFECKKRWGHEALPVFYHVPPEVVAKQSGIYEEAFRRHEKGTKSKVVFDWRKSLAEAANLSGFVLENRRPEEDDVREIVEAVKKILEFDSEKRLSEGRKRSCSEFLGQKEGMEESRPLVNRKATPLIDEFEGFYGRDAEKKAIIDLLISDDDNGSNHPGVIPIVGMGGVGKTTLAQHVCNDKAVQEQFKIQAWVCVSVQFDVTKVTKEIYEKVTGITENFSDLNYFQHVLKDVLDGKKFLLVLDDVWCEEYEKWRQVLIPLRSGATGSKIIITTRSKEVASKVQTVPTQDLRKLENEDCWKVFARHARLDVNSTVNPPELKEVGKEIVKKCGGLPLAAKALGGVLRWQTKAEKWKAVLKSEIWEVQNANILPALAMSYIHLPSHLKRCFAYCAIFPQACKFQKEKLVALWMSEGFLVQQKGNQSLEEMGDMYFDHLVSRLFFQHSSNSRAEPCFVMHDLVHDLARFVSGEFCSRLDHGTLQKIGEKARHLSYERTEGVQKKFQGIHETPFLRSFVLAEQSWVNCHYGNRNTCIDKEVIDGFLRTRKLFRVLSLSFYEIRELPNSIGNLKHMRHLDLSDTSITLLPDGVTALFNLEILILRGCWKLVELPADMARLINLCQLDISSTSLTGMPPEMGKLKKLSKLSDFIVGEKGGSRIKELGHLHNLRGEISIEGLQNVKDDRTSKAEAILKYKENLRDLKLSWNVYSDDSRQVKQVLERLQPHTHIECIRISDYNGTEFPNWVGDISFSKLKQLHMIQCGKFTCLPPLGQLASLEGLFISCEYHYSKFDYDDSGNEVLKAIGVEFYGMCKPVEKPFSSLKRLVFHGMTNWREWSSCNGAFPVLEELKLSNCHRLMFVPSHLPSLKRLWILNCGVACISVETFPNLGQLQISRCNNLESLVGSTATTTTVSDPLFSPSLTSLHIERCNKLVSFSRGGLHAPNLKIMEIKFCYNLESLPQGMHSLLPSLEELRILECPRIESFPDGGLPSKLLSLQVEFCEKLVGGRMQWGLQSLPSLSKIVIIAKAGSCEVDVVSDEDVESGQEDVESHEEDVASGGEDVESYEEDVASGEEDVESHEEDVASGEEDWESHEEDVASGEEDVESHEEGMESSFPEETLLPSSLKSLKIGGFAKMKSLNYKGLQHLTSLQSLSIGSCRNLESLPEEGLPSSLSYLNINSCPLLEQRCEQEIGEDWPKIKHIHKLYISSRRIN